MRSLRGCNSLTSAKLRAKKFCCRHRRAMTAAHDDFGRRCGAAVFSSPLDLCSGSFSDAVIILFLKFSFLPMPASPSSKQQQPEKLAAGTFSHRSLRNQNTAALYVRYSRSILVSFLWTWSVSTPDSSTEPSMS